MPYPLSIVLMHNDNLQRTKTGVWLPKLPSHASVSGGSVTLARGDDVYHQATSTLVFIPVDCFLINGPPAGKTPIVRIMEGLAQSPAPRQQRRPQRRREQTRQPQPTQHARQQPKIVSKERASGYRTHRRAKTTAGIAPCADTQAGAKTASREVRETRVRASLDAAMASAAAARPQREPSRIRGHRDRSRILLIWKRAKIRVIGEGSVNIRRRDRRRRDRRAATSGSTTTAAGTRTPLSGCRRTRGHL